MTETLWMTLDNAQRGLGGAARTATAYETCSTAAMRRSTGPLSGTAGNSPTRRLTTRRGRCLTALQLEGGTHARRTEEGGLS